MKLLTFVRRERENKQCHHNKSKFKFIIVLPGLPITLLGLVTENWYDCEWPRSSHKENSLFCVCEDISQCIYFCFLNWLACPVHFFFLRRTIDCDHFKAAQPKLWGWQSIKFEDRIEPLYSNISISISIHLSMSNFFY